MMSKARYLHFLCFAGSLTLGLGIFAPSFSIEPRFGDYTAIVKALDPEFGKIEVFSIFSGITKLFEQGSYFVGGLLLLFSVCFPLWKFGAMWEAVFLLNTKVDGNSSKLRLVEKLGKYSMLDIFVLAVLVIAIKGLPGGSKPELHWGIVAFVVSILISFVIPGLIKRFTSKLK